MIYTMPIICLIHMRRILSEYFIYCGFLESLVSKEKTMSIGVYTHEKLSLNE